MKKKIISILSLMISVVLISNCGGNSTPNPNAGFKVFTYAVSQTTGVIYPSSGNIQGVFLSGSSNTTGTVTSFNQSSSGGSQASVILGAKAPGTWRMSFGPGLDGTSHCLTRSFYERTVSLNGSETLNCLGRLVGFAALPDAIDVQNPPSSVSIRGEGIQTTFGTPMLAFYDASGNVAASVPANQVSEGKHGVSNLSVNVPQLALAYDGIYAVVVHNINPDGTWDAVGATSMTIYGNPPPPPTGGGGDECPTPVPDLPQLPCENQ